MIDVLIAGGGPAGSMAALTLARAGARVVVVDRDTFPRDKLCGDTLNPGAVRLLGAAGLVGGPLTTAVPLRGMRITSAHSDLTARYPHDVTGLAVPRRDFDAWLLDAAVRAGARVETGVVVRGPVMDTRAGAVRGLVLRAAGSTRDCRMPATVTIGADGRRSVLAQQLGLRVRGGSPRRWAFGTYAEGVSGMSDVGEMHIRDGWYLGLAPLGHGVTNVCVVTGPRPPAHRPLAIIRQTVAGDPRLAARLAGATFHEPVRVLGPLAATVRVPGVAGLLLAGDAAGFIDPMTGDGLHLALQSAQLAAEAAGSVLAHGNLTAALDELVAARVRRLGAKLRFNRTLRRLVDSPVALRAAGVGARYWPDLVTRAVVYAGDVA